jgi:hypothetical protein
MTIVVKMIATQSPHTTTLLFWVVVATCPHFWRNLIFIIMTNTLVVSCKTMKMNSLLLKEI